MSKLMNIQQVADMFGVTKKTIYEWVKVGRISQPINKHGTPRWDHDEAIKAFVAYTPTRERHHTLQSATL